MKESFNQQHYKRLTIRMIPIVMPKIEIAAAYTYPPPPPSTTAAAAAATTTTTYYRNDDSHSSESYMSRIFPCLEGDTRSSLDLVPLLHSCRATGWGSGLGSVAFRAVTEVELRTETGRRWVL